MHIYDNITTIKSQHDDVQVCDHLFKLHSSPILNRPLVQASTGGGTPWINIGGNMTCLAGKPQPYFVPPQKSCKTKTWCLQRLPEQLWLWRLFVIVSQGITRHFYKSAVMNCNSRIEISKHKSSYFVVGLLLYLSSEET